MSETVIDLARRSGLIATGMHVGRLVAVEEKIGPRGTYFSYTVRVEEQSEANGRELPYRVSLSPDARWKLDEFLDAVGAPMEGSGKPTDYLGSLIKFHVVEDSYNDKPRSTIDGVFPLGMADPNPELAKQVAADAIAAIEDPTSPNLGDADDEIPF